MGKGKDKTIQYTVSISEETGSLEMTAKFRRRTPRTMARGERMSIPLFMVALMVVLAPPWEFPMWVAAEAVKKTSGQAETPIERMGVLGIDEKPALQEGGFWWLGWWGETMCGEAEELCMPYVMGAAPPIPATGNPCCRALRHKNRQGQLCLCYSHLIRSKPDVNRRALLLASLFCLVPPPLPPLFCPTL
ncbi:hypothetical protein KP509_10G063600 [Ceratopteris richardii]|uniref:Uncharacterized protein n=1 Tax=Ceratopteris richardii TaxID=49495 RepID=A0A8T2U2I8_CERRI|nr:hypothetical protein KP509_10G063600 [Ceratopteris richardii]